MTTFLIGGLLAGAAALLYTLKVPQGHHLLGRIPVGHQGVLGGGARRIGNLRGALLGGLLLGIMEKLRSPGASTVPMARSAFGSRCPPIRRSAFGLPLAAMLVPSEAFTEYAGGRNSSTRTQQHERHHVAPLRAEHGWP